MVCSVHIVTYVIRVDVQTFKLLGYVQQTEGSCFLFPF
jgi:hypothetical protein